MVSMVFLTNSFPMHPFSTPWVKKPYDFLCFQGAVKKGCIMNKWINAKFFYFRAQFYSDMTCYYPSLAYLGQKAYCSLHPTFFAYVPFRTVRTFCIFLHCSADLHIFINLPSSTVCFGTFSVYQSITKAILFCQFYNFCSLLFFPSD